MSQGLVKGKGFMNESGYNSNRIVFANDWQIMVQTRSTSCRHDVFEERLSFDLDTSGPGMQESNKKAPERNSGAFLLYLMSSRYSNRSLDV